jgi:intracellular sulfur oxidation DsrE/DsrF family protein
MGRRYNNPSAVGRLEERSEKRDDRAKVLNQSGVEVGKCQKTL